MAENRAEASANGKLYINFKMWLRRKFEGGVPSPEDWSGIMEQEQVGDHAAAITSSPPHDHTSQRDDISSEGTPFSLEDSEATTSPTSPPLL